MYNNGLFSDSHYNSSSEIRCETHPLVTLTGVCAYCLTERLEKLICSACGEKQTLCSNSCSVFSSEGDSRCAEDGVFLKRSSSSCLEIKRKHGFWRIGTFFRRIGVKRGKEVVKTGVLDEKLDLSVIDYDDKSIVRVSRSRSLCSLRRNRFFGSDDGSKHSMNSVARSSGFNGGSETEQRRSGFDCEKRRIFSLKEGYLIETEHRKIGTDEKITRKSGFDGDDSDFIDLKFDLWSSSESKNNECSVFSGFPDPSSVYGSMRSNDNIGRIESGIDVSGKKLGVTKSKKSFMGWKWIFKKKEEEIFTVNC